MILMIHQKKKLKKRKAKNLSTVLKLQISTLKKQLN